MTRGGDGGRGDRRATSDGQGRGRSRQTASAGAHWAGKFSLPSLDWSAWLLARNLTWAPHYVIRVTSCLPPDLPLEPQGDHRMPPWTRRNTHAPWRRLLAL